MDDGAMKVGELARRTGLSVRTLHHYDAIGLLRPCGRTAAGHRLYGRHEIERLQKIASLRHLGLGLEEIRECLDRPEYTLERVLDLHVERLDREVARHGRLRDLVRLLRDRIRSPEGASVEDLTRTIEVTMSFEKYYTPEQLEQLARRREEVGEARIAEVQREWEELFAAYGDAMDRGLDPASPEVQALARRSAALVEEFTGGDPGIRKSLENLYAQEGPEKVMAAHGASIRPGLWEYMGKATAALERKA
ncbi:MAG TPA: MerR family transcriptional regulator [Longimicrobiales bacterium]|nr:MerR family transcriptional regulator [Longimicrobiales bacterium]